MAGASPQAAGGRRYRARFVRCGRARTSANQPADIEILAQALSRAVGRGLFDHKAVFVDHAYASLPGTNLWQNASVERLVGVTNAASFDGCSVEGIRAIVFSPSGTDR
jgi:hypothetical protein